jgi:hypothetical protein
VIGRVVNNEFERMRKEAAVAQIEGYIIEAFLCWE